jgi:hypothetical protein
MPPLRMRPVQETDDAIRAHVETVGYVDENGQEPQYTPEELAATPLNDVQEDDE